MRRLCNTLFVMTETAYASLDGENIVIKDEERVLGRFPLHLLEGIYLFTYKGASPSLMGKCAEKNINLVLCSPRGRFLARVCGESNGNVLLRRKQYRYADNAEESNLIARNFITGKIFNERQVIERMKRDHSDRIDVSRFQEVSEKLREHMKMASEANSLEYLRGIEGSSASLYFSLFDEMILQNKEDFWFHGRTRRPPLDRVNALLSYAYMLLSCECTAALSSVGLDPYVGFMHQDRPGRNSLALDLMEELRASMADRFVLSLINNRMVSSECFIEQESGAVLLSDKGKKIFQKEWQERKQVIIEQPFLKEKIEWGLIPYAQALLVARYLRGDLDGYPPFLWK